jgi:DNA-directed RNA polymerase subunit RPC12/RpoP
MATLSQNLELDRCPHCSIANPNLMQAHRLDSNDHAGNNHRKWAIYKCMRCGGLVTASASAFDGPIKEHFPTSETVSQDIPQRAKRYLEQAIASIHAPDGAVLLCASSVDAMLKEKGYLDGKLYGRIQKAVEDNLLTSEMASWAHEVRLDANDQRHSDIDATNFETEDAKKAINFVKALGEFLFVLPAKIQRGLSSDDS